MSDIFLTIIQFLQQNDQLAYIVLFAGSYAETLIGPGFFIQGEFFFLPGAILSGIGVLNIWFVFLVCILGGVFGDFSSFVIGRKYGKRVISYLFKKENKYLKPHVFEKATNFFKKSGTKSIFFARFLGPISWVTPFIAGVLDVSTKDFIKYNVPGVILGIGQYMLAGYFLGFSYQLFLDKLQAFILAAVTIVVILLFFLYKSRHPIKK